VEQTVQVNPAAPEAAPVSPVAAMWKVLLEPKATFEGLRHKAPWILPWALGFVVILAFTYTTWSLLMDAQIERIRMNESIPDGAREAAMAQVQATRDNPVLWQVAIGPVFGTVAALIATGIWLGVGNVLLGGNANFKKIWSMFNYAGMSAVVSLLVKWAMMTMKGSAEVHTSLAVLAPDLNPTGFLFRALDGVDVFSIWFFILIGFGLAAMCRVATQKAMTVSFAVWAVWVFGFKAGLGSLLGGFMGM
jgi:hypothetical protein